MKKAGILIIIIGLLITIFTAISFSTRKKVAEIGNLEIIAPQRHHLEWSPLIGVAVMGIGGVLIWGAHKK